MIFQDKRRVRLTTSELNLLRRRNAQQGETVSEINTVGELYRAIIGGLPADRCAEMLAFMESESPQQSSQDASQPSGEDNG